MPAPVLRMRGPVRPPPSCVLRTGIGVKQVVTYNRPPLAVQVSAEMEEPVHTVVSTWGWNGAPR